MGIRKALIHFVAKCDVCEWQTEDYLRGQVAASDHSRKTGHIVSAEAGYSIKYGTKKDHPEETR